MLHRTQARQVEGVYQMFMRRYPDIRALAEAPREEVIEVLAPLGLNWRIHGMLNAFRQIWKQHGSVPLDMEKLVEVKGIGPYIAGSTLCFSADRPLPLVDSNTVRVIGRVFGLDSERVLLFPDRSGSFSMPATRPALRRMSAQHASL